ncbi:MAG: hypothetical protein JW724_07755 [Candidatus Altiarchaeota archaeon]|nr:hypothetical protein [Candidatus Altiarchaeota archaeon]
MSDKIVYVALGISLIGLLLLTYASEVMRPPLSSIGDIDTNSIGKLLHVQGNVSRVHEFSGGSAVLTVSDGSREIDVYLDYYIAKSMPEALKAKEIEVVGEVDEYEGRLEIKPKKSSWVSIIP